MVVLAEGLVRGVPAVNLEVTIDVLNTVDPGMVTVVSVDTVKPVVNPLALTINKIAGITGNNR